MRHLNVVIPDDCHDYLHQKKRDLKLKTLDDVITHIIYADMKTRNLHSKAKIKEGKQ